MKALSGWYKHRCRPPWEYNIPSGNSIRAFKEYIRYANNNKDPKLHFYRIIKLKPAKQAVLLNGKTNKQTG
jgi:hypothetical protein